MRRRTTFLKIGSRNLNPKPKRAPRNDWPRLCQRKKASSFFRSFYGIAKRSRPGQGTVDDSGLLEFRPQAHVHFRTSQGFGQPHQNQAVGQPWSRSSVSIRGRPGCGWQDREWVRKHQGQANHFLQVPALTGLVGSPAFAEFPLLLDRVVDQRIECLFGIEGVRAILFYSKIALTNSLDPSLLRWSSS